MRLMPSLLIIGNTFERSLGSERENSIKSGSLFASGQFCGVMLPLNAKIFDN
jgi:hypothetical protein